MVLAGQKRGRSTSARASTRVSLKSTSRPRTTATKSSIGKKVASKAQKPIAKASTAKANATTIQYPSVYDIVKMWQVKLSKPGKPCSYAYALVAAATHRD